MSSCNSIAIAALMTLTSACAQAQDATAVEDAEEIEAPDLVVINVAQGDVLNMRAEPNADAPVVGILRPNTGNIHVTAQSAETADWIYVEAGGMEGWVNANYLGYSNYYEPLPMRLHCSGTEPFWGMELSYSRADISFAFRNDGLRAGFHAPISPANRSNIWLRTRFDRETDIILLEAGMCSDGMSEERYAYSLLAKLNDNLLGGCCN